MPWVRCGCTGGATFGQLRPVTAGSLLATSTGCPTGRGPGLFIGLLKKLRATYADRDVIHVILDNFGIHSSRQTQAWLDDYCEEVRAAGGTHPVVQSENDRSEEGGTE